MLKNYYYVFKYLLYVFSVITTHNKYLSTVIVATQKNSNQNRVSLEN